MLSACVNLQPQPDYMRQFALGPTTTTQAKETVSTTPENLGTAFIARPEIPSFLDTPHMQYRALNGEILSLSKSRWAEPLSEGTARALGLRSR